MPKIESKRIAIDQLVPNPRNPRRHDERQLTHLHAALERFGQTKPILVRKANLMVIAGHGVTEAAKRAGWSEIDVQLWDVTQELADAFMLADNRLSDLSDHDTDRVAELLREINPADHIAVGFDPQEVSELLREIDAGNAMTIEDMAVDQVYDDFWISVRGPLQNQAEVLERLKAMLRDMPEVSVELGTIGG